MSENITILNYHLETESQEVVGLHSFQPESIEVAQKIIAYLQNIFSSSTAEHVGSTAIPGCDGKGIIDLLLISQASDFDNVLVEIVKNGFQPQSGGVIHSKESPMFEGGVYFNNKFFRIHLHVVTPTSPKINIFRKFRDVLKADENLVKEYIALKKAIIDSGIAERAEYTKRKQEFINTILNSK